MQQNVGEMHVWHFILSLCRLYGHVSDNDAPWLSRCVSWNPIVPLSGYYLFTLWGSWCCWV